MLGRHPHLHPPHPMPPFLGGGRGHLSPGFPPPGVESTTGQQINGEGQQEGCERFYWGDRKETLGTIRLTPGWGAELGGQQRDGPAVPGGSGSRFGVFPLDAVAVELENGVGRTLGSHEAALHLQRGGGAEWGGGK